MEQVEQWPNDEHAERQSRGWGPWHCPSSPGYIPSLHSSHRSDAHLTHPDAHSVHADEASRNHPASHASQALDVVLHSAHPGMAHSARQPSDGQPTQEPSTRE